MFTRTTTLQSVAGGSPGFDYVYGMIASAATKFAVYTSLPIPIGQETVQIDSVTVVPLSASGQPSGSGVLLVLPSGPPGQQDINGVHAFADGSFALHFDRVTFSGPPPASQTTESFVQRYTAAGALSGVLITVGPTAGTGNSFNAEMVVTSDGDALQIVTTTFLTSSTSSVITTIPSTGASTTSSSLSIPHNLADVIDTGPDYTVTSLSGGSTMQYFARFSLAGSDIVYNATSAPRLSAIMAPLGQNGGVFAIDDISVMDANGAVVMATELLIGNLSGGLPNFTNRLIQIVRFNPDGTTQLLRELDLPVSNNEDTGVLYSFVRLTDGTYAMAYRPQPSNFDVEARMDIMHIAANGSQIGPVAHVAQGSDVGFVDLRQTGAGQLTVLYASAGRNSTSLTGVVPTDSNIYSEVLTVGTTSSATATSGADYLLGTISSETINGLAGNDTIVGASGDDTLNGGDGDDEIQGNAGVDSMDGGLGTDTVDYADALTLGISGVSVDLYGNFITGFARDEAGNFEAVANFENAITGAGDDYVYGTNGNNILNTGAGNDYVQGWAGNDSISAGAGSDVIFGGDGNDIIRAGEGYDFVWAGDGANTAFGEGGNDVIAGSSSPAVGSNMNDRFGGGEGDDILIGGSGNDLMFGDNFIIDDISTYSAMADWLFGGEGEDELYGGNGDDVLFGDLGSELGRDLLYGELGNDILIGGNGNDYMDGGFGSDSIWSNGESDTILLGADADLLWIYGRALGAAGGVTNCDDFSVTEDRLVLGFLVADNNLGGSVAAAFASGHLSLADDGFGATVVRMDMDGVGAGVATDVVRLFGITTGQLVVGGNII